jgi:cardiolipin synthase
MVVSETILAGLFVLVSYTLAAMTAFRAIQSARTPQGAVGWVLFLAIVPYAAVPIYLFLGHSRFPGYILARRSSKAVIEGLANFRQIHPPATDLGEDESTPLHAYEMMSGMPLVSGNDARILVDGAETFDAIFAAIEAARSYVLVQFYIFRDDRVGRRLKTLLIEKAREGCSIRLLYDSIGSYALPSSYLADLRAAGVVCANFHAIRTTRSRFQINFRNHRKIVVVDGEVAFTGGLNVGDEYLGRSERFGRWRDTHLLLRGPVVAQLQLVFAEDWNWATEERLRLRWEPSRQARDLNALIVAPGPADDLETGSLYFCNAIGAARRRLWIATPYFVPDTDILNALVLAKLRGVDVRILVPSQRDHLFVWLAGFTYYEEMRQAGVEVWRYTGGFMHQKVILVDDRLASVGTVNLDNRSCRLNFEVTAVIHDADFAEGIERMLERDFAEAERFSRNAGAWRSPLIRYGSPFARLLAPLL